MSSDNSATDDSPGMRPVPGANTREVVGQGFISKGRRVLYGAAGRSASEVVEWWRAFLRSIPGEIGCRVRSRFYGFRAGRGCRVLSDVVVYYPERLTLAEDVGIAVGCQINAAGGVTVGRGVRIGPGVIVWSQNHGYKSSSTPIRLQGYEVKPIVIEDDVWIAAGATILPGVVLGRGTVVAAGAIVTKSTESYQVVGGVPAREISRRA